MTCCQDEVIFCCNWHTVTSVDKQCHRITISWSPIQRSRSFWQVTPHDSRHLSQRLGIPCSSLTNTLTWTMMRNAWLSVTETNLLSTRWLIQQLAYLQLVMPLSEFLARVVFFFITSLHMHVWQLTVSTFICELRYIHCHWDSERLDFMYKFQCLALFAVHKLFVNFHCLLNLQ